MRQRTPRRPGRELQEQLGVAIPTDHARQASADHYIAQAVGRPATGPWRVLDLGCGTGESIDRFRAVDPQVRWTGVDLEHSPEVAMRTRADAEFVTFDGIHLPFADGAFDLIYCHQVLEHAAHPEPLLAEVTRVLAPTGFFAGSTSQLEPFHSYSFWNYTPVGFARLLEHAGMQLVQIRPGIDGLSLISTRLTGLRLRHAEWWGNRSPFNALLDRTVRFTRMDVQTLNATKLLFCGQFTFLAERRR